MRLRGASPGVAGKSQRGAPITLSAPSPASLGRKGKATSSVRSAAFGSWARKSKWRCARRGDSRAVSVSHVRDHPCALVAAHHERPQDRGVVPGEAAHVDGHVLPHGDLRRARTVA